MVGVERLFSRLKLIHERRTSLDIATINLLMYYLQWVVDSSVLENILNKRTKLREAKANFVYKSASAEMHKPSIDPMGNVTYGPYIDAGTVFQVSNMLAM